MKMSAAMSQKHVWFKRLTHNTGRITYVSIISHRTCVKTVQTTLSLTKTQTTKFIIPIQYNCFFPVSLCYIVGSLSSIILTNCNQFHKSPVFKVPQWRSFWGGRNLHGHHDVSPICWLEACASPGTAACMYNWRNDLPSFTMCSTVGNRLLTCGLRSRNPTT